MMKFRTIGLIGLAGLFSLSGVTLGAASMTLMGTVSDSACGLKHKMPNAAACTAACVKEGADYALIVGNKVYTLKTSDAKVKAELATLAAKMADVTGDVSGTTVTVTSAKMGMAKKP